MIQIDIPIAVATGGIIADAAHRQIVSGRAEFYFRAALKNMAFQIFGLSWIPAYFLANYFGWETTHMWWAGDSIADYPLFWPVFLVVFFLAGILGFEVGRRLISGGSPGANRMIYGGIFVYVLLWVFAQTDRTFKLGTYSDFVNGRSPWFWQDPQFLRAMIVSSIGFAIVLVWTLVSVWRDGANLDRKIEP